MPFGGPFAIFSLTVIGTLSLSSYGLTMDSYLKDYLKNSDSILEKKANLELAEAQLTIAKDLWKTNLEISPIRQEDFQEIASSSTSNERSLLSGSLTQELPIGVGVEASGYTTLSESNETAATTESSISTTITVDLWQNFAGTQDRNWITAAEKSREATALDLETELRKECHRGILLFSKAALAQQALKVSEQRYNSSKEAYNIAKSSHRKRLIRKIDLYTAEEDWLATQDFLNTQSNESKTSIDQLLVEAGMPPPSHLADLKIPEGLYSLISISETALDKNPSMVIAKLNELSTKEKLLATKKANRLKVQLGASRVESQGKTSDSSSSVFQNNSEITKVFLTMEWPWNNTRSANIAKARAEAKKAEALKYRAEKEAKITLATQLRNFKTLHKEIASTGARVELLKKRAHSALKLIRNGKIQFDEYVQYANFYLDGQYQLLETKRKFLETKFALLQLTQDKLPQCAEHL